MLYLQSIFLVCTAFAVASSLPAKPLTNYQYLQLLTSKRHLTLSEAQQRIKDNIPMGEEVRIIPERLVDSMSIYEFVTEYNYQTPYEPVKSIRITDETYIQLLTKGNYMTESDYAKATLVIDSTRTLPDRKIKGSVISRVLKQLELSASEKQPILELPSSFEDSSLTDAIYVKLLSSKSCLTATELQERLIKKIPIPTDVKILEDRRIDATTISDFVKSREYTLAVEPVVNTRISDEDYIKTLTKIAYMPQSVYEINSKMGYDVMESLRIVPDREISATVLSRVLKEFQATLAAMDPESLTDRQYMGLLSSPEFITVTEAKEYENEFGKLPSDVTVLPERKLRSSEILRTMKKIGKNVYKSPMFGNYETDEDYVKLLTGSNVDLKSNDHGGDVIDSIVFVPNRKVAGSAFSRVMKKIELKLLEKL